MKAPTRKQLALGAGAVAAVAVAFLAGRFSKPAEVKTVSKSTAESVKMYAAHGTTTSTDRTKVRIVTKTRKTPEATETIRVEDRAADLQLHSDWTGTESKSESSKAEATTVTRSSQPGWSVGASALWSPGHLSPKPETYTLEVDRRLFGTFWLGVRATTDKQIGAAARVEF